mmetsp:Transcript_56076/g.131249  ORF Transcript_56076/g.131249 Transcript_56076/m.131249 type:complete len:206 (+) Transcript_56076:496-1113(+)
MLGVIPLPQLGEHLHCEIIVLSFPIQLSSLAVLPLKCQDLCSYQFLLFRRQTTLVAVLLGDAVEKVDVPHISDSNERLPSDVESQALQCIQSKQTPIALSDTKAGYLECGLEVLLLNVSIQRCALRHIDSLHGDVVQAKDLRSFKAHHEALELLHVRWKCASLDTEHVVPAVGQHVFHLRVPRDAVGVRLLVHERLGVQVVYEQI